MKYHSYYRILKDLKKESKTVCYTISLTLQNSEPPMDNYSKDERKGLRELQSETSIAILPAMTLKHLKALKDNRFTDNKLCDYQKPTDSPAPRFYGQPKVSIGPVVGCGSPLYSLNKYIANIFKVYVKHGSNNAKNSTTCSDFIRNVAIEDGN